jgi:hypothetical protein
MNDVERIGGRIVLLDRGRVRLDREIDRIREKICVAIIPVSSSLDPAAMERTPGCLGLRRIREEWHVLMEGEPEAIGRELQARAHSNGIRCARVPLEELFIEMLATER